MCDAPAEIDAQQIGLQTQMMWLLPKLVQVVGSMEEDLWGRRRVEALMAQLTLL